MVKCNVCGNEYGLFSGKYVRGATKQIVCKGCLKKAKINPLKYGMAYILASEIESVIKGELNKKEMKVFYSSTKLQERAVSLVFSYKARLELADESTCFVDYVSWYNKALECLKELCDISDKIKLTTITDNPKYEYYKLIDEKQWHMRDALEKYYNDILKKGITIYRNNRKQIELDCVKFNDDIENCFKEFDEETKGFAKQLVDKLSLRFGISFENQEKSFVQEKNDENTNFNLDEHNSSTGICYDQGALEAIYRYEQKDMYNNGITYNEPDELLVTAVEMAIESGQASVSMYQRRLKIGYQRAAHLIDQMEARGIIGPFDDTNPREVLITKTQWREMLTNMDFTVFCGTDSNDKDDTTSIEYKPLLCKNVSDNENYKDIDINHIKNIFVENSNSNNFKYLLESCVFRVNPAKTKVVIGNIDYLKMPKSYDEQEQLVIPIITDVKKLLGALTWICQELRNRYKLLSQNNFNDILEYNSVYIEDASMPEILILIDDYSIITDSETILDIQECLKEILLKGRNVGIYLTLFSNWTFKDSGLVKFSSFFKVLKWDEFSMMLNFEDITQLHDEHQVSLDKIDNCTGIEFERIVKEILISNKYENVIVTKSSGDQGADVIAYKDGVKYAIQCKKYSQTVGNSAVQEAIGSKSIYDCHVAVVMTNNYFTKSAKELAQKNLVLLWDREVIKQMLNNEE